MYVCHVIPFIQAISPLVQFPCTDVMIHNPSHLLRGSFSRSSPHFKARTPGKMPAGEGPRAACAGFKACGDSTKTRENMHLPGATPENGMRPCHRLALT